MRAGAEKRRSCWRPARLPQPESAVQASEFAGARPLHGSFGPAPGSRICQAWSQIPRSESAPDKQDCWSPTRLPRFGSRSRQTSLQTPGSSAPASDPAQTNGFAGAKLPRPSFGPAPSKRARLCEPGSPAQVSGPARQTSLREPGSSAPVSDPFQASGLARFGATFPGSESVPSKLARGRQSTPPQFRTRFGQTAVGGAPSA